MTRWLKTFAPPLLWYGIGLTWMTWLPLALAQAEKSEGMASEPPQAVVTEPDAHAVRVGNLVYGRMHQGRCFSDEFLQRARTETTFHTTGKLHPVRLNENDLAPYPLLVLAGDQSFELTLAERKRLKAYLEQDGFVLVSAGCASPRFDRAFRREIAALFPEQSLEPLGMDHPVYHTLRSISSLVTKAGPARPLLGLWLKNRLVLLYAPDGLNDTDRMPDCCCCGGQELLQATDINLNILAYVLSF